MLCKTAALPVSCRDADLLDFVAVMVAVPGPVIVAKPSFVTVATALFEDVHTTTSVSLTSWPSSRSAVTFSCTFSPAGIGVWLLSPLGMVMESCEIPVGELPVLPPPLDEFELRPLPQPARHVARKRTIARQDLEWMWVMRKTSAPWDEDLRDDQKLKFKNEVPNAANSEQELRIACAEITNSHCFSYWSGPGS
jgi:hypothetical protein